MRKSRQGTLILMVLSFLVVLGFAITNNKGVNAIDNFGNFKTQITGDPLKYLIGVAGIGLLSSALLDAAKKIISFRWRFNKEQMVEWLLEKGRAFHTKKYEILLRLNEDIVDDDVNIKSNSYNKHYQDYMAPLEDLISLGSAGDEMAFFDLPVENLAGLCNSALGAAMDAPYNHKEILLSFSYPVEPKDLETIFNNETDSDDYKEARGRIIHMIQRNIDAFQIRTSNRWEGWNKMAVILLSGIICLLVTISSGHFTSALILAAIGGVLAPVAKDLVSAIRQMGN